MESAARLLVITLLVFYYLKDSYGGLITDENVPKFSVGSALRYLSKAVFTKALLRGLDPYGEVAYALRSAHIEDSSDCIKRLLCELQSKNDVDLSWDELLIKGAISSAIDYTSPTLQFQLAVGLGRRQGLDQCATVYSRCSFDSDDIMEMMRQRGTSLELSTEGDRECTVLFLWNKKSTSILPPTTIESQIN